MSDYYRVLPISTRQVNGISFSYCGASCSSEPAHRSFPAYLAHHYGTRRRHHQAWTRAGLSVSWPWQALFLVLLPGALHRHTPGAFQTSVGTSLRHPAEGNNHLSTLYTGTRLLKGTVMYLHSLLGPPHRLQVARYCRRVDNINRQKLESTTTSRGGL
jgi:hypothetical protein